MPSKEHLQGSQEVLDPKSTIRRVQWPPAWACLSLPDAFSHWPGAAFRNRNTQQNLSTAAMVIGHKIIIIFSSVQFSCSVMSDSLWPHELQHTRPPCPSPTPRVHLNSRPLSRWCHPTIPSSVHPFSSCLQSLPVLGSFPLSQFFTSDGQSFGLQLQHQSFQWIFRTDVL